LEPSSKPGSFFVFYNMNEGIFHFDGESIIISGIVPAGVDTEDLLFRLRAGKPTLSNEPYHAQMALFMGGESYELKYTNPKSRLEITHLNNNIPHPVINR
jgi:hypothetical protein